MITEEGNKPTIDDLLNQSFEGWSEDSIRGYKIACETLRPQMESKDRELSELRERVESLTKMFYETKDLYDARANEVDNLKEKLEQETKGKWSAIKIINDFNDICATKDDHLRVMRNALEAINWFEAESNEWDEAAAYRQVQKIAHDALEQVTPPASEADTHNSAHSFTEGSDL